VQQPRGSLSLDAEPGDRVHRITLEPAQQLHRDRPGKHLVLGLPDLARATSAQQSEQAVAPCEYLAVHTNTPQQFAAGPPYLRRSVLQRRADDDRLRGNSRTCRR
jgi:hypothetical protein